MQFLQDLKFLKLNFLDLSPVLEGFSIYLNVQDGNTLLFLQCKNCPNCYNNFYVHLYFVQKNNSCHN